MTERELKVIKNIYNVLLDAAGKMNDGESADFDESFDMIAAPILGLKTLIEKTDK